MCNIRFHGLMKEAIVGVIVQMMIYIFMIYRPNWRMTQNEIEFGKNYTKCAEINLKIIISETEAY